MSTIQDVALNAINVQGDTQMRVTALDLEVVEDYRGAMANGADFPPVILFFDGTTYWPGDGFHRVAAARANERDKIKADVRQGTRRDAILFAAGANSKHGLRRSMADKRRAIETLVRDPEWAKWSNREIGKACAVDGKTVAKVRHELTGKDPTAEIRSERTYTTKHGTTATMDTAAIGAKPTSQSVTERVLAGISTETLIEECRRRGLEVSQ
jgi:hypothetical protein